MCPSLSTRSVSRKAYLDDCYGREIECLIDTAAAISILREDVLRRLWKVLKLYEANILRDADHSLITALCQCTARIIFGQRDYPVELIVLLSWSHKVVIGLDSLSVLHVFMTALVGKSTFPNFQFLKTACRRMNTCLVRIIIYSRPTPMFSLQSRRHNHDTTGSYFS